MSSSSSLDALERLDRDLVYVFVAGPGVGEGIAVALPGAGWLLVDGCAAGSGGSGLPLESIVTRWSAGPEDPVVAMVLTHPHEDHAAGFSELVGRFDPAVIALAGKDGEDLLSSVRAKLRARRAAAHEIRTGSVLAAFLAIDRWAEDHAGRLLALRDGMEIPVGSGEVTVTARAPDLMTVGSRGARGEVLRADNHMSIVLEINHGSGRIVLTSDLPRYLTGTTTPVPSGWDHVMSKHAHLGAHTVLKIPHHGSAEAMHPDLMDAGAAELRAWSVTPHNSSRLPRVTDMDGLPRLLGLQRSAWL